MSQRIPRCSTRRWRRRPPAVVALFVSLVVVGACRSTAPAGRPSPPLEAASQVLPPETPAGEEAPAEGGEVYQNVIRWSTASELDNFGYDVYRSESEDGPFVRINPEVIGGAGSTDEPSRYSFVDDTNDPCRTYYYYVESISMSGVRERFTPIGKVPPKILSAKDGEDDSR